MNFLLEAAAEGGAFNPLDIGFGFLFWSVIAFAITLFILAKYGWGPLAEAVEGREQKIREDIEKAEAARNEAEASLQQYRKQLDEAAAEAKKTLEEAREAGERARENILAEAQAQAVALKTQAEKDISAARDKALGDIKAHVVEVAMAVSRQVVSKNVDEAEHAKLVAEALDKTKGLAG
jgi:F-type H+-transporting ATPase subunit b